MNFPTNNNNNTNNNNSENLDITIDINEIIRRAQERERLFIQQFGTLVENNTNNPPLELNTNIRVIGEFQEALNVFEETIEELENRNNERNGNLGEIPDLLRIQPQLEDIQGTLKEIGTELEKRTHSWFHFEDIFKNIAFRINNIPQEWVWRGIIGITIAGLGYISFQILLRGSGREIIGSLIKRIFTPLTITTGALANNNNNNNNNNQPQPNYNYPNERAIGNIQNNNNNDNLNNYLKYALSIAIGLIGGLLKYKK